MLEFNFDSKILFNLWGWLRKEAKTALVSQKCGISHKKANDFKLDIIF
ncbi:hypothetical protein LEP1GSC018_2446 [Leptospira kirschneri str. 2008720114]|nr:hypothetical protein LEP1GSC018_2446 [Leptospira kirschneri str. 2008720114]